jgi:hypothetical protein
LCGVELHSSFFSNERKLIWTRYSFFTMYMYVHWSTHLYTHTVTHLPLVSLGTDAAKSSHVLYAFAIVLTSVCFTEFTN